MASKRPTRRPNQTKWVFQYKTGWYEGMAGKVALKKHAFQFDADQIEALATAGFDKSKGKFKMVL